MILIKKKLGFLLCIFAYGDQIVMPNLLTIYLIHWTHIADLWPIVLIIISKFQSRQYQMVQWSFCWPSDWNPIERWQNRDGQWFHTKQWWSTIPPTKRTITSRLKPSSTKKTPKTWLCKSNDEAAVSQSSH